MPENVNQPPSNSMIPETDDDVLLFETSPYGNLDAIVQQDGRTVYFYLNERGSPGKQPAFGTRACWVRNLQTGPYVINEDDMRDGLPPMLPRTHVKLLEPSPLPRPADLKIVWFEEGNGAALLETTGHDQPITLAVIPPWSGVDGFHGYAAECAAESPLCWPLPENANLQQRIQRAEEFWASFAQSPDPFAKLQPEILQCYDTHFLPKTLGFRRNPTTMFVVPPLGGQAADAASNQHQQRRYYSIDGNKFPPRGLVHYQTEKCHILATVAMSLCPQPMVEMFTETPASFRRIELAIELPLETSPAQIEAISKTISSLAAYPWQQFNWFGHGHTCQFRDLLPNVETASLVHDAQLNANNPIRLPDFREDPINLLWLTPITSSELQAKAI